MNKDLKSYLTRICIPAVAVAIGGVALLWNDYSRKQRESERWLRGPTARIDRYSSDLYRALKEESEIRKLQGVLGAMYEEESPRVRSAFIWCKGKGTVWETGESFSLKANKKWRAQGRKNPDKPVTGAPRGWDWLREAKPPKSAAIAWVRLKNYVVGLVVDMREYPTGGDPIVAFLGSFCILALLAATLATGGWWLLRSAHKAREESERKTTFIDNLSHELKIPLAVVRMKTERLLAGKVTDPEKLRAAYQTIADENGEVIRQVDDLLDLVRTGKGTRRYSRTSFDLNLVAHEAATALRDRFSPDGLEVRLADGNVLVNADPDTVRQIVRNLLDNAAKYAAAKGPVEIAVRRDGGRATVTVSDRGDGIPPDQRERIFERFYRIDNDLTRTTGGTGIGLCLARCFARDMGGDVTVSARPGGGSVFTLELPEETHG